MTIEAGVEGAIERTVSESDTAIALGSGDVDLLGTPAVVALCEAAAVKAIDGILAANETTVGIAIHVDHLSPTPVGEPVVARALLKTVDGRKLEFTVEAFDGGGMIARGHHVRMRVDRERFVARARERK